MINKQLSNPQFVERAPPELVEKTRANLKDLEAKQMDIQKKRNPEASPLIAEKRRDGFIHRIMSRALTIKNNFLKPLL